MAKLEVVLAHIGANVRALRSKRGLTQERLATQADLDLRFVQRVERGQTNLSVAVLVALGDVLGLEPAAFFKPAVLAEARVGRPPKSVKSAKPAKAAKPAKPRPRPR